MIDYLKQILIGQFEASLAMMKLCVEACPAEHWDGKIANSTFRQVAYHTLFCTDMYLSANEEAFSLRDLHARGGDERGEVASPGLSQEETLSYVIICREKMLESLAAETPASLAGSSGFSWRKDVSRGELHIYNIRHIQHHTGQLSAYLRRVKAAGEQPRALPWVATGWR
jgi:uncharacterized damage-inducible protein DinB